MERRRWSGVLVRPMGEWGVSVASGVEWGYTVDVEEVPSPKTDITWIVEATKMG